MMIRADQMNAMASSMRERFAQSLVPHLRERYGPRLERASDADLVRLASRGIDDAARYGVHANYDVRRFVEHMVEFFPGFDTKEPWAARILNGNETGAEKMDNLDAYTTFEHRQRSGTR